MKHLCCIALLGCLLLAGCGQEAPQVVHETVLVLVEEPGASCTPYPTYTPAPPLPTLAPPPPLPTYTPYPPLPPPLPLPTYTSRPPLPTYTPFPPLATYTPYPTYSPAPLADQGKVTPDPSQYLGKEQVGGRLGALWSIADIRHRSYTDHLRVVWEMAEAGDHGPLYRLVEVDDSEEPHPAGHESSWGEARIDLVMSDVYAYGYPLEDQLPIVFDDDPAVTRIGLYPTFSDAHLGFSIGLRQPTAYQVYELLDPVRLVIDVFYVDP